MPTWKEPLPWQCKIQAVSIAVLWISQAGYGRLLPSIPWSHVSNTQTIHQDELDSFHFKLWRVNVVSTDNVFGSDSGLWIYFFNFFQFSQFSNIQIKTLNVPFLFFTYFFNQFFQFFQFFSFLDVMLGCFFVGPEWLSIICIKMYNISWNLR